MHQQGASKLKIAQELGLSRWQVRRFVDADQFPERAPKVPRRTILTPFEALLQARWQAGERATPALFRVLQAAGYTRSIYTVRPWVQRRHQEPAPHTKPAYDRAGGGRGPRGGTTTLTLGPPIGVAVAEASGRAVSR